VVYNVGENLKNNGRFDDGWFVLWVGLKVCCGYIYIEREKSQEEK